MHTGDLCLLVSRGVGPSGLSETTASSPGPCVRGLSGTRHVWGCVHTSLHRHLSIAASGGSFSASCVPGEPGASCHCRWAGFARASNRPSASARASRAHARKLQKPHRLQDGPAKMTIKPLRRTGLRTDAPTPLETRSEEQFWGYSTRRSANVGQLWATLDLVGANVAQFRLTSAQSCRNSAKVCWLWTSGTCAKRHVPGCQLVGSLRSDFGAVVHRPCGGGQFLSIP